MNEVVFLLEEPSMEVLLESLLPRIAPGSSYRLIAHEGRTDLQLSIPRKIKAWGGPANFVIVHDQHTHPDCRILKRTLVDLCNAARPQANFVVRIACTELESWFLGDLKAIEIAYGLKGLSRRQSQAKFRDPDKLTNAAEIIQGLVPGYRKRRGAETIGPHLDIQNNQSSSFRLFVQTARLALTPRLTGGHSS